MQNIDMASWAVGIIAQAVAYLQGVWQAMLDATGMQALYLAIFTFGVIVLYLLSPFLLPNRSGSSDTASAPKALSGKVQKQRRRRK